MLCRTINLIALFCVLVIFPAAAPAQPACPTAGEVLSHQKISDTEGAFTGILDDSDHFGSSVASIGDLDGDGVADLAVGAVNDSAGGTAVGAVWILFLNDDGTVKSHQKISATEGGFTGILANDNFGRSVASIGDLDGDGVAELAVGALRDDDGGNQRGAVWILFLNNDGTVKSQQKISDTEGGFTGMLDDVDQFGISVASIGDLDADGVVDLAVGATQDDDGGNARGAVWVLFLNDDGTVKSHQKISDTEGGFTGILDDADRFGSSVASIGDLDADGVSDLAVGAQLDDDGGGSRGAVWVLFLNADGTVKSHQKISDTEGGFAGMLDNGDFFGSSVASIGDLDGDGMADLAVGAEDDDGGVSRGAVWVLFLDGCADGDPCTDADEDGFGNGDNGNIGCPNGTAIDCDDNAVAINPSATEVCDGIDNDCDGITDEGSIEIHAAKHTVGSGSHPGSTKVPLVGIEVCAYDKSDGSCARDICGGISHQHYECIATICAPTNCCPTDNSGECAIEAPPGDYIVISNDATKTVLPDPLGVSASDLLCGDLKKKHLQQIEGANGGKKPGKTTRLIGSELLIIEPEYVLWDDTEQPYPFIFETIGDWGVTTSVAPPEGFVSDYDSLSADVYNEIEAVQFTITEVGSELVPTETTFEVTHKGQSLTVRSRVGIMLTPEYAQSRGFNVAELRAQGLIKEHPNNRGRGHGNPRGR